MENKPGEHPRVALGEMNVIQARRYLGSQDNMKTKFLHDIWEGKFPLNVS